jgi:DNA-binding HxlR family transcriptional regulator
LSIAPGISGHPVYQRWAPEVLLQLADGPRRSGEIQRGLPGLNSSTLAKRLRELRLAGLLGDTRRGYGLTETGRAYIQPIQDLASLATVTGDPDPPSSGESSEEKAPAPQEAQAIQFDVVETAIGLRPQLLQRALQLYRHAADAEDAVSEVYVKLLRNPPTPRTPKMLLNWLRTVLQRQQIDRFRKDTRPGTLVEGVVSLDALTGWPG